MFNIVRDQHAFCVVPWSFSDAISSMNRRNIVFWILEINFTAGTEVSTPGFVSEAGCSCQYLAMRVCPFQPAIVCTVPSTSAGDEKAHGVVSSSYNLKTSKCRQ